MLDTLEHMGNVIVIVGTNASGKSDLGIQLAKRFGGEVVSADSRQVYRGLDLGTGKVNQTEMQGVPHHLLDVVDPMEPFSLAVYQQLAYDAIDDILRRGKRPLLVGGTGLYVDAVVQGYSLAEAPPDTALRELHAQTGQAALYARLEEAAPQVAATIHPNDRVRTLRALEKLAHGEDPLAQRPSAPRYRTLTMGVTWPKEILHKRIDERLRRRLDEGMIGEVEALLRQGVSGERLMEFGLEYRFIYQYLQGDFESYDAFYEHLARAIRQFAKRQMTWFRRNGAIHWLHPEGDLIEEATRLLSLHQII